MNIVIIGFGGMGSYHAELIKAYEATSPAYPLHVKGVYDIDPARCEAAKEQGLKVYESPEEIWSDTAVDAVLIATPNDLHAPYTYAAAKAGKHVISEKPVGMSSKEAAKMFDAAKSAGVVFEVHQNRRWDEDFLTVKKIYESGEIGWAHRIESLVMGGNGIPGAWRKELKHGGGMMLDWGVHLIDQMLQMIPSKVKSVACEYSYIYGEEVEDGFFLTTSFENGVVYRIVVTTDCFRSTPRWQVYGTEGTATVDDWSISGGITKIRVKEGYVPEGIKAGNGFTRTMAPRSADATDEKPLDIVRAEPFAFYKNFAAACAGKEVPLIKKDEVVRVYKLMEAARKSAATNTVVKITL